MDIRCQNLIGGRFVDGASTTDNLCPADTELHLGTAPDSGREEAEAAVAAAKEAQPAWAATPAPTRGVALFRLVGLLERDADELAEILSLEEGKILPEAKGEVMKTIRYVTYAAGDCRRMTGLTSECEAPGALAMTLWRPLGVIGLITPWNFPVCIPLWKIAPAIASGNAVVLKPAPETPATAHKIAQLCQEAGIPDGIVNVVHGDADPAMALIEHPDVAAISFTGSTSVGLQIEGRCGALHKRIQCEMGGKNPLIVLDDADVATAAAACAKGAFGSTGQRCTATSRAIVMHEVADDFVSAVVEAAGSMKAGHPLDPATTMGPSVSERQLAQVLRYMGVGREEAELRCGGTRLQDGDLSRGYFPCPTVFDHVEASARIATEEIFGPVLSVIRVGSPQEAIEAANSVDFGLTGSVFTSDLSRAFQVIQHLDTGMNHVNNPTIGGEAHMPFGGIKNTGVGPREMGPDAWKFYAEEKTIYINHAGGARKGNLY
ncbi:MAG TPA: aldehyde dehydrogenase family protein [Myxococcota bacterium]|nr:aldehyde dehydrogenase family protein [Myxococcota bacterium]